MGGGGPPPPGRRRPDGRRRPAAAERPAGPAAVGRLRAPRAHPGAKCSPSACQDNTSKAFKIPSLTSSMPHQKAQILVWVAAKTPGAEKARKPPDPSTAKQEGVAVEEYTEITSFARFSLASRSCFMAQSFLAFYLDFRTGSFCSYPY